MFDGTLAPFYHKIDHFAKEQGLIGAGWEPPVDFRGLEKVRHPQADQQASDADDSSHQNQETALAAASH
jgi:hypothetical protein